MLLRKVAEEKPIHGARTCKDAPKISHLFFAAYCVLFAQANLEEWSKIVDIVGKYEGKINYNNPTSF